jgi:hypothetical protein
MFLQQRIVTGVMVLVGISLRVDPVARIIAGGDLESKAVWFAAGSTAPFSTLRIGNTITVLFWKVVITRSVMSTIVCDTY